MNLPPTASKDGKSVVAFGYEREREALVQEMLMTKNPASSGTGTELGVFVGAEEGASSIHVTGPAGVGKTRLVVEACGEILHVPGGAGD